MDSTLTAVRVLGLEVECVSYCDSWQPARDWAAADHGPPCQAWSVAGKGGGMSGPRGPMWQFTVDAIAGALPRAFVLEN
eukprot:9865859-Alexandrium_andersonii.AAC.1